MNDNQKKQHLNVGKYQIKRLTILEYFDAYICHHNDIIFRIIVHIISKR